MLFPRVSERKNTYSYLCLGFSDNLNKIMQNIDSNIKQLKIFKFFLNSIFAEDLAKDEAGKLFFEYGLTTWQTYQQILISTYFPEHGKGSLRESYVRGTLAGMLLTSAIVGNISISASATAIAANRNEIRSFFDESLEEDLPLLTADNLNKNIWPRFKSVAHFWAALQDFQLPFGKNPLRPALLDLNRAMELGGLWGKNADGESLVTPLTIWPSKFARLRAILFKADHIFKLAVARGPKCRSSKPLLSKEDGLQIELAPDSEAAPLSTPA